MNTNKIDASRRYFGYFIPTQTVKEVAAAVRDTLSLYINNDPLLSYDNNSADGIVKTAIELAESSKNTLQLDYTTNGGNIALGLFTRTSLFSLAVAPSVSYTTTGAYDDYITNITDGGFNKVASTSTRPFSFKPTFLQKYELWPLKKSIGMTFSRDVANPILYLISEGGSGCCFVKIIKPGAAATEYKLKDMNLLDNNLVISSDGQRLIFASEDTNKEVMVIDISNPKTFAFGGNITQPSSGYGSMIASITMPATPKCLAVKPYNTIKSTSASGTYEVVAQLDNNICGVNNAAVASGGIYIAGGSRAWTAESINTIYKFDPTQKYTAAISPLSKTLPKAVKWHA
ncbi:MAG: hypothetical protein EOM80_19650, partial [Erysipelotrichia bacterium]|nr:hypothetical protein [Erysipelotrichia bacterium]